jgi:hypothetical protein
MTTRRRWTGVVTPFTDAELAHANDLLARIGGGAGLSAADALFLAASNRPEVHRLAAARHAQIAAALAGHRLATFGWAPCSRMPVDPFADLYSRLDQIDAATADLELASVWAATEVWDGTLRRIQAFGNQLGVGYAELFLQRRHVLEEAIAAFEARCVRAAIGLVLAQVEGICIDVTGGKAFFTTKPDRVDVTDTVTFAGADGALNAVRDLMSRPAKQTSLDAGLLRHGVMHGRSLGYGTPAGYWKSAALLAAVVEWSQKHVWRRLEERDRRAEERWAGSNEVNAAGVRFDRRGFSPARQALRTFELAEAAAMRTSGSYAQPDRLPPMSPDLPAANAKVDDHAWWACTQSEAGYWFGLAMSERDGLAFWEGGHPPPGGPPAGGWSAHETSNWSTDVVPGRGDPLPVLDNAHH